VTYQPSSSTPLSAQQTHTLAIVSLIFGILGLVGICPGLGSIVAVITGGMAQREIQSDPVRFTGDGLAKAGLILGWIGIGLVALGICAAIVYFLFIAVIIGTSDFEGSFRLVPSLVTAARVMFG
jgi:hypothetical protein